MLQVHGRALPVAPRCFCAAAPEPPVRVATINTGSTSSKVALFEGDGSGTPHRILTRSFPSEQAAAEALPLVAADEVGAVAHRIVHGGSLFTGPAVLDASAVQKIREFAPLAPLHNQRALGWVEAARQRWPAATQVAVFDTAFFSAMPEVASAYAIDPALGADLGVRRYGFHGLAHASMWEQWCGLSPALAHGGRLITVQLGGGCSMTALDRGVPRDTSMGFSPLEGLMMATRSGDIDPAVVPYLAGRLGVSAAEIIRRLNSDSGLLGVSGLDGNPRKLIDADTPRARAAVELYCYRIRKYLGAFLAVLGGCDGIVFGGGVGEHVPEVRARALAGLAWAGIVLGDARNAAATGGPALISHDDSAVKVHVVAVDEDILLARAAITFSGAPPAEAHDRPAAGRP